MIFAAGNDQTRIDFPGSLPNVLTVGATNQWDERKTKTSQDGEDWWGSNYGASLNLMAPGVMISTTDIQGDSGYGKGPFTHTFNGTSSATPHVAAAAALMLSAAPHLREDEVRAILNTQTDALTKKGKWNRYTGNGRLNTYSSLWHARRR